MTARRASGRNDHQPVGRWIRPWRRLAIYMRDGFRCVHCGCNLLRATPREMCLDHVVSRGRYRGAKGGPNRTTNLVTSCADCNHRRNDRTLQEFSLLSAGIKFSTTWAYVRHVHNAANRAIDPIIIKHAKWLCEVHVWNDAHRIARAQNFIWRS
jgi:hypothetical protein